MTTSDTSIVVLAVGGTGESHPGDTRTDVSGMLSNVTAELPAPRFVSRWVPYPASFGLPGNPTSEVASMASGVANLVTVINGVASPVVLLGYSQGAQIVRTYLGRTAGNVVAAGLVADPYRPLYIQEGPMLSGYGLAGDGPTWPHSLPVFEIAAYNDVITNAPADSPLRAFADTARFFTCTDIASWIKDSVGAAVEGLDQHLPPPAWLPAAIADAVTGLDGYGIAGHHLQYDTALFPNSDRTYCQYLADLIIKAVGR